MTISKVNDRSLNGTNENILATSQESTAIQTGSHDYWDYYTDATIPWYERAIVGATLPLLPFVLLSSCEKSTVIERKADECPDDDGDGFGAVSCGQNDCDDTTTAVHPGADEVPYDGIDQDCSGVDLTDVDGDGFDATEAGGNDCNDTDPTIYPGATEIPYDGLDQDCSGADLTDVDGDGYNATETGGGDDCNDTNASINPGAEEICNGIDDNCDGQIDNDAIDQTTFYQDADGDNYGNPDVSQEACFTPPLGYVSNNADCDDTNANISPAGYEVYENGIDENCDGWDMITAYCDPSYSTIQEAVDYAALLGGGLTVYVCAGSYSECNINIPCDNIELIGETSAILQGPCGSYQDPFMTVGTCADDSSVNINNIEFQGDGNNMGIQIYNTANVSISDCTFEYNRPGILIDEATSVSVNDSSFVDNMEPFAGWGGAISAGTTTYPISLGNLDIDSNGNGLFFTETRFSLSNSSLIGNYALGGGALTMFDSQGDVTNTTFESNSASGHGGAIFLAANTGTLTPTLSVDSCTITGNTSSDTGGGIYVSTDGVLTSVNTDWTGNSPDAVAIYGGSTYGSGDLALIGSTFTCSESTGTCE